MAPVPQALEILRRVQIFNGLTATELQFLAERAVPRNYSKGELLFTEGDPCTGLFVIESGRVRILDAQIRLAVQEASDLDFVPAAFRK